MKYLKATHKNEYRSVVNTYNLTYSDIIFSNYTKQIDIDDCFNFIRNNIIITNSVRIIISDMNYTKKCIQPTNLLKIHTSNFGTVLCDYTFLKYKSICIMTNIIYKHKLKFNKKKLHTQNIFLIEHLNKCSYNLYSNNHNNRSNAIIFKNIKNVEISYKKSQMSICLLIFKNIHNLYLNLCCINLQYGVNLNNLCNAFKLEINCCYKITNAHKITKNYKLKLFGCTCIFNKFIFSNFVDLIDVLIIDVSIVRIVLNKMNLVHILQIECFLKITINKSSFKYIDLLKIK